MSLSMEQVSILGQQEFVEALRSVFEGPPWIVMAAWQSRPFSSITALHQSLCAVMYGASERQKEELIRAHPDLVGRAALAGTLTPESSKEQASAGLDRLSLYEINSFVRLNREYSQKFGFPFVICARENKKEAILAGFAQRLGNTRQQEIETALREICKIAWYRLQDLFPGDR